MDSGTNRLAVKPEDTSIKGSSSQPDPKVEKATPPRSDPPAALKEPPDAEEKKGRVGSNGDQGQPLAPPPRPSGQQDNTSETPDYFSSNHNNSHFSLEPNPFEQSFGNPSTDAPNKATGLLPPVAALTSPAPLVGGQPSAGGYNWANSLRSGPLSPAMLGGPVGTGDYFDPSIRGSFPTPNESSLRTGLTPGGGGSMFPAPSPNSQALFNQLASGGATPSTLDFHRTAMNAAAARKDHNGPNGTTSQAQEQRAPVATMDQSQHDSEAASGLYLLAQATNNAQNTNQFAMPTAPANSLSNNQAQQSQNTSPNMAKRSGRNANGSIGGSVSESARGQSSNEHSDSADQKPTTRNRGKRTSTGKSGGAANGRRKAEDAASKPPASKKQKQNNNPIIDMDGMDSDDEQQMNQQQDQYHADGKKMTDEEKRKNFLERNRVAALKCRQRKKQWLANLQAKVEIFSSENDTLSAQVNQMRDEIVQLKQILIQHKDCPISQGQGLGQYFQQQQEYQNHTNPYGMAMGNGQSMMAVQQR
ncbi:MAG: hypothetical protein LQ346_004445 [Caloplaca aetnensis]|nr:MAG: hypothetical protein LQ346_004445 [Caloplaca aetnensis]